MIELPPSPLPNFPKLLNFALPWQNFPKNLNSPPLGARTPSLFLAKYHTFSGFRNYAEGHNCQLGYENRHIHNHIYIFTIFSRCLSWRKAGFFGASCSAASPSPLPSGTTSAPTSPASAFLWLGDSSLSELILRARPR